MEAMNNIKIGLVLGSSGSGMSFSIKREMINASKSNFEKLAKEYKAEITDTDSLLAFPLKNDLTSDYAAETAYKEKAIEFGFNIEHEEDIELD
jgi:hypothetical protein